ncbi:P-loop containing nucleoside triphosphate hydrolase protein [Russula compacta]|nr:P-loop containing nucleoside triphosphate hydrolase protein [Russula compacta]
MSDTLVLNLALGEGPSTRREPAKKKGGRWTDRCQDERPPKRPRKDSSHRSVTSPSEPVAQAHPKPRPPTQIISSLFSSNPNVEHKPTPTVSNSPSKPSNAPLTDSSSFIGLGLNPLIATHLTTKMNIQKPTSIQRASLLALLSPGDPPSWRDAFIQSQTGSGKTLSYLLPILHDLLPLSTNSYIDRSIGTIAIIIAPTRELAKQISDVLEVLLKLRLQNNSTRLTRWLVSGLLTGGATRGHEKARIRKGIPILVATPGRLLDHLQNTTSFDVSKCRWLVLDEADRLMELGFADTIKGILACMEGSRKLAIQAVKEEQSMEVRGWDWGVLAGTALQTPIIIKATEVDLPGPAPGATEGSAVSGAEPKFTPPAQLLQKYIVVPLKLRLVTLIALLRSLLSRLGGRGSFKVIVFLSCTDSVDFHWRLLGGSNLEYDGDSSESSDDVAAQTGGEDGNVEVRSPLLPDTSIFRLHGSLPLATRRSSLRAFSSPPKAPKVGHAASVLLCTSVAARGLDLPLVRAVVQYDLPTEGGATEYIHRVGRTARAGRGGQAWTIIAPSEEQWVEWVQARIASEAAEGGAGHFEAVAVEEILRAGFGGQGKEYEDRATEVQLAFERWCLQRKENVEMARKAFASHLRAYATHPLDEKHMFHVRHLHLGHLAKSFALREAPSAMISGHGGGSRSTAAAAKRQARSRLRRRKHGHGGAVRKQGRLVKKSGTMVSSGLSEFQVALASGDALERLINNNRA